MPYNEPQLREVREFHKTKFKENPKTQAKHFGFCKFNIFYKTECNCDLKAKTLKKAFTPHFAKLMLAVVYIYFTLTIFSICNQTTVIIQAKATKLKT